jgi:thiosulfate/3-mercaptopyruvate sulfurtransferase
MHNAFDTLIDPDALAARLGDAALFLVDCRFDLMAPAAGESSWRQAHVPGSVYAHLERDLSGPATGPGGRHPLPSAADLIRLFSAWGITAGTQVVAYDDAGGFIAGRLWWLLRWMGHDAVAVLNGGYRAWVEAGYPVDASPPQLRPGRFEGSPGGLRVVDARGVSAGLADGSLVLIDVRAPERFAGLTEPLDAVAGHVPGAVNLPLTGNLDRAGRFLPAAALRDRYQALLAGRDAGAVACMCGSGVSACQALLALETAGLGGAALYAGSWSDWISDPARPVAPG